MRMSNYYGRQALATQLLEQSLQGNEWARDNLVKLHVYFTSDRVEVSIDSVYYHPICA